MTEDDAPEGNFAEFEAAANSGEPIVETKEPEAKEPADPDEDDDIDDAGEVNDKADDQDGEDKDEEKGEKRRSKPMRQRLGEVTEKWRTAEQRAIDAEARAAALEKGEKPEVKPAATELAKPDPNAKNDDGSDKYEFGEADPEYLADLTDWKVDTKLAERDAKTAEEQKLAKVQETVTKLDTDWAEKAKSAVERYPDFNEVVLESAAAGEWECGPIMAIAISASEQGADIAYHMATNPKEAAELNKLAQTDPMEAARRFGRLEARYEMQAKPAAVRTTNAPEPPQHRARGGSGKYEVDGSTTDFAAFEAKANASGRR